MRISTFIKQNSDSLAGKTIAISGGTGGIGKELCHYLAMLGAELILLDRNKEKSLALQESILAKYPSAVIHRIQMDLEEMDSVKRAVSELLDNPLHALILNAGAYHIPRHRCSTGFDNIFQINFLSPYYIAKSLRPHIDANRGKVIAVGSIAHTYSKSDPDDPDFSTRKKHSLAYGNAKRYLMFALHGLYHGAPGLSITHPGITFTNITAHYPKLIFAIIKHPMKVIFMKPKKAALCILQGVFEDCRMNEWIGPKWFNIWGFPKKRLLKTCSAEEAGQIFEIAERLSNLI